MSQSQELNLLFSGWSFQAKDATGNWYCTHPCWKDSDGVWVYSHPTDPKGCPIKVPNNVKINPEYWSCLEEKEAWMESVEN